MLNMKQNITLLLALLISTIVTAQGIIYYKYDDSGNRTERKNSAITRSASVVLPTDSTTENTIIPNLEVEEPYIIETALGSEVLVKIHPNPTYGIMQLEINGIESYDNSSYSIYDINGKMLRESKVLMRLQNIDIRDFVSGNYVLSLMLDGKVSQWKIIKQ